MSTRPRLAAARRCFRLVTAALAATGLSVAVAAGSGYLGLALAVNGEGFFLNPTIRSIKVQKVNAGSPAARAGIAEGDEIVEVEGRPVAGAKARDLQPYVERNVGETVRLTVRKPNGDVRQLSVKTEAKPD